MIRSNGRTTAGGSSAKTEGAHEPHVVFQDKDGSSLGARDFLW
jgi:hypothetical protein